VREPAAEPWGLIEMWIEDPDGIRIVLVEVPADHPLRRDSRSALPPRRRTVCRITARSTETGQFGARPVGGMSEHSPGRTAMHKYSSGRTTACCADRRSAGCRHREGPFDNRAPTRPIGVRSFFLNCSVWAAYKDQSGISGLSDAVPVDPACWEARSYCRAKAWLVPYELAVGELSARPAHRDFLP
jgi:hypothetical protein